MIWHDIIHFEIAINFKYGNDTFQKLKQIVLLISFIMYKISLNYMLLFRYGIE
jgi:hypothetical protein